MINLHWKVVCYNFICDLAKSTVQARDKYVHFIQNNTCVSLSMAWLQLLIVSKWVPNDNHIILMLKPNPLPWLLSTYSMCRKNDCFVVFYCNLVMVEYTRILLVYVNDNESILWFTHSHWKCRKYAPCQPNPRTWKGTGVLAKWYLTDHIQTNMIYSTARTRPFCDMWS